MSRPIVGRPADRESVLEVDRGWLVSCAATRCGWSGLFDDRELALEAINNHARRERRGPGYTYHAGMLTAHLVELVEPGVARAWTDSIGAGHGSWPLTFDAGGRGGSAYVHELNGYGESDPFPVTPGGHPGVDELLEPADLIETSGPDAGKVWRVSETRSLGVPTWSIAYVPRRYDGWPSSDREVKQACGWLNELVAVDGAVVCRYDGVEHAVVGHDHEARPPTRQLSLEGFA